MASERPARTSSSSRVTVLGSGRFIRFAKEQGGIGAYVHPFSGNRDPLEGNLGTAKAFPVDVALEALSYHELWSQPGYGALIPWHHALNNGFKVPATGGEDSISSLHRTHLVGAMRGYFHLGADDFTAFEQGAHSRKLACVSNPCEVSRNGSCSTRWCRRC